MSPASGCAGLNSRGDGRRARSCPVGSPGGVGLQRDPALTGGEGQLRDLELERSLAAERGGVGRAPPEAARRPAGRGSRPGATRAPGADRRRAAPSRRRAPCRRPPRSGGRTSGRTRKPRPKTAPAARADPALPSQPRGGATPLYSIARAWPSSARRAASPRADTGTASWIPRKTKSTSRSRSSSSAGSPRFARRARRAPGQRRQRARRRGAASSASSTSSASRSSRARSRARRARARRGSPRRKAAFSSRNSPRLSSVGSVPATRPYSTGGRVRRDVLRRRPPQPVLEQPLEIRGLPGSLEAPR